MRDYHETELWKNVTPAEWNDWKWQLRNRITDTESLSRVLDISPSEKADMNCCLEKFRMAVTPYYATLIESGNPDCPIRAQAIPSVRELESEWCDMEDPLGEEADSPVDNIVHRYPDRVLFLVTFQCAMYCRHCTRRRVVGGEDSTVGGETLAGALEYIRSHENIRDVLISGGDPLTMTDEALEHILSQVRAIPHVESIRIGTRTPVVLPMRITDGLLGMLRRYHPLWINTHFNHPAEVTAESAEACRKIVDAGIPLGNQSVLLKNVNDDADILKELLLKLVKNRVRPYYLYQCDVGKGIGHFRTPVEAGIEIMRRLRGYISGYAVPTFVIDAPGGGGKIPLQHDYVISMDDREVVLQNYRGDTCVYPNVRQNILCRNK